MKNYKILFSSFLVVLCTLISLGCANQDDSPIDFPSSVNRVWIGPEYWANPMQDWQLNDGRIECVVSGGERNVVWLTKELSDKNESFQMQVDFGQLKMGTKIDSGWIGFWLGVRGEFGDYRDAAIRGEGFPVGLTTKGVLFIGNKVNTSTKVEAPFDDLTLQLSAIPENNGYIISLNVSDKHNKILAEMTEDDIKSDWVKGLVSLMCSRNEMPVTPKVRRKVEYVNYGTKHGTERRGSTSFWFSNWEVSGAKVEEHPERVFGPILFTQYTLSKGTVKLTAQMPPIGSQDGKSVSLSLLKNNKWKTFSEQGIDAESRTATFRMEDWKETSDVKYKVSYDLAIGKDKKKTYFFKGTSRHEPNDKDEIVVAGFTGNNDLGFPNSKLVEAVKFHNPDLLFFSGDQIYEGVGGYDVQRTPIEKATIDYLRKWYMFGWAYKDILKNRPSVAITDDHDVYHGNIWGEEGKATSKGLIGKDAQDDGGYKMPAQWVNMVQRTQTSHIPDPFDATPVKQGITVYYTDMNYAGISFAILEDRKFKSAPKGLLPKAKINNGWAQNRSFNSKKYGDVKGAVLLGERQLDFLNKWTADWSSQTWMKVVLSQTIFANVATLPKKDSYHDRIVPKLRVLDEGEYPPDDIPVSDIDSNGWPQTARDNALEIIRKAFSFHLAGDQHLGSFIKYGVDEWKDAGYAFCVPSISNVWPRRWFPRNAGLNRQPNQAKNFGDFEDGFGNKMTVHAVSNPVFTGKTPANFYDRATGYGIVRFNKKSRDITVECWPTGQDPSNEKSKQFSGWPIVVNQLENYNRNAVEVLPELVIAGTKNPVVQIIDEQTNETVYTIRINENKFRPKVFRKSSYTLKVGQPDKDDWQIFKGIKSEHLLSKSTMEVKFN